MLELKEFHLEFLQNFCLGYFLEFFKETGLRVHLKVSPIIWRNPASAVYTNVLFEKINFLEINSGLDSKIEDIYDKILISSSKCYSEQISGFSKQSVKNPNCI